MEIWIITGLKNSITREVENHKTIILDFLNYIQPSQVYEILFDECVSSILLRYQKPKKDQALQDFQNILFGLSCRLLHIPCEWNLNILLLSKFGNTRHW